MDLRNQIEERKLKQIRSKSAKSFKVRHGRGIPSFKTRLFPLSAEEDWDNDGEDDDWSDDEWNEDEGWGEDEEW